VATDGRKGRPTESAKEFRGGEFTDPVSHPRRKKMGEVSDTHETDPKTSKKVLTTKETKDQIR